MQTITFFSPENGTTYISTIARSTLDYAIEDCPPDMKNAVFNPEKYEWEIPFEVLDANAKSKRSKLLSDTDFYFISDYPLIEENKQVLQEYRQALRDITKQEKYPYEIVWPVNPLDNNENNADINDIDTNV